MRSQFPQTVLKILEQDLRLRIMLGDIGVYSFREVFSNFPDNIFNIGILEQSTIGVAAGFAIAGDIPVVHTIAPFLVERAYEQLKIDFGYQQLGGNFVSVGGSYDYAALGCTHHCPADLSLLLNIPGFELIVPGTDVEFDRLFRQRYAAETPTYYRLSEQMNQTSFPVNYGSNEIVRLGSSSWIIVAIGPMLDRVVAATEELDATVVYCSTVFPFDFSHLEQLRPKKVTLVTPTFEGFGFDLLGRKAMELRFELDVIGIPREFIRKYGANKEIDQCLRLDAKGIRERLIHVY